MFIFPYTIYFFHMHFTCHDILNFYVESDVSNFDYIGY